MTFRVRDDLDAQEGEEGERERERGSVITP